jgi:hypothetical protein
MCKEMPVIRISKAADEKGILWASGLRRRKGFKSVLNFGLLFSTMKAVF